MAAEKLDRKIYTIESYLNEKKQWKSFSNKNPAEPQCINKLKMSCYVEVGMENFM